MCRPGFGWIRELPCGWPDDERKYSLRAWAIRRSAIPISRDRDFDEDDHFRSRWPYDCRFAFSQFSIRSPALSLPPSPPPSQPGSYVPTITSVAMSRSCSVNGNSLLSAGPLSVEANSTGQTTVAQPIPATGGVEYQQSLPNGFIAPGQYTVSASGPLRFQGTLTVPPPIQITTPLTPGKQISVSNNFVINWTGGAAGELVRLKLVANIGLFNGVDTAYVDASAGSYTFSPICIGNPPPMGSGRALCLRRVDGARCNGRCVG